MKGKKYENRIVKYHNDMNTVSFRKFTAEEFNLFFAMCHKLKEQGDRKLELSFDEVRELVDYKFTGVQRFMNDMKNTYLKMLQLNFGEVTETRMRFFTLFTDFDINSETQTIKIGCHQEWQYILNQLQSDFTRFELQEFTQIRSTYSKTMYRLLKQFRQRGYLRLTVDEFRRVLDVPKSYRMSDINKAIFTHLEKELPAYFFDFKITKVKARKGNKIEFFDFTFRKEIVFNYTRKNDMEKIAIEDNPVDGQVDLSEYFNWIEEQK